MRVLCKYLKKKKKKKIATLTTISQHLLAPPGAKEKHPLH